MNLPDKILKVIKEGLNTAFNFDDIANARLDDIKTEPTKNTANTVKYRWLYPKLAQLVSEVLNDNEPTLTLDEQNTLFENCVKTSIKYQFPNQKKIYNFVKTYTENFNQIANLNWIDTSNITDMTGLFSGTYFTLNKFNGDISQWDVSNVKNMENMFQYSEFNGDISQWDVSNVENMFCMFYDSNFNGDISRWDVSKVKMMCNMFAFSRFDQDISMWKISPTAHTETMFWQCSITPFYKPQLS